MKNIINQVPWSTSSSSSSSSTTTTTSTWGAPSDGSRTNFLRPYLTTGYSIPNNGGTASGYGVRMEEMNGQLYDSTTSQVLTIKDDALADLVVHRHRFLNQRDTSYLDFYIDDEYQGGCLKFQVLKPCWLLIEGCVCLEKISGVNTQSQGVGLLRKNSDTTGWYSPSLGGLCQTIEPAAGGGAFPINIIHYFPAGTICKVYVCTTIDTSVVRLNSGPDGGLLSSESYLAITRISQ